MRTGLMFLTLAFFVTPGFAETGHLYEEGTHYVELEIPIATRTPDQVEVMEYFSYGCPHCYRFDPMINSWKKTLADDVVFKRTPAVWNDAYQVYAQTYYTAEALGVLDDVHSVLFEAIHSEQRRLTDPKAMAMFFAGFGVDAIDFAKVYNSFGVRASVQQAIARGRGYRAGGVPAIIVNGRYRVEGNMAGSNADMLRVTDYLISLERKKLAEATSAQAPDVQ
ncbi:MAG: thiol:disulfide interchange protein DsbA/DsbL [Proteobacteria bacterium]|jgi:thiol:disulfide interchange protein DsbA|nr:thiol:disulfide interchange protein DsbA/DsbL [Pseudomonadota bacterium]MDA1299739.1 thiol:disulfide interchange protein DsbA/DsbL [Pseudomonadota bacterium]